MVSLKIKQNSHFLPHMWNMTIIPFKTFKIQHMALHLVFDNLGQNNKKSNFYSFEISKIEGLIP